MYGESSIYFGMHGDQMGATSLLPGQQLLPPPPKVKKVATVTTVTKVKEDIIWEELRSSRGDFVAPTYKKSQSKTLFILLILI